MAENVGNKWSALLNGAIDNDDTSVAFDNAVGTLPAVDFRIVVQDSETDDTNREIMLVTAGTSSPLTVTRAQEGTTGVSHGDNSYIIHVLTAGALLALMSDSGPGAEVTRSSNQSIAQNTFTPISWTTEVRDDADFFDAGSPTGFTVPSGGWYAMTFTTQWAAQTGLQRRVTVVANNVRIAQTGTPGDSIYNDPIMTISTVAYLSGGQTVYFEAYQNQSAGGLNVSASRAAIVRLGVGRSTSSSGGNPVRYDIERYTGGDITVSSTTAGADLASLSDVVVAATTGDLLMIGLSARPETNNTSSLRLDVKFITGATENYVSSETTTPSAQGISGWFWAASSTAGGKGGEQFYIVQAADIASGNVTCSLRAWLSGAQNWVLAADSDAPFKFWVRNLGQS